VLFALITFLATPAGFRTYTLERIALGFESQESPFKSILKAWFFSGFLWCRVIRDEFHKERSSQSTMMRVLRVMRGNHPELSF
jgi:hypothetical protein